MDPLVLLLLLLTSIFSYPFMLIAQSPSISRISVVGVVYCDTCSSSTFSKQSYFLQGVEVHIQCRFRATSPKTNEEISFSVNRTTDEYGVYNLEIPSVDGVNCVDDGSSIVSLCQASLIGNSTWSCNVPFVKSTTREISLKSKQDNLCIYSLSPLSYIPSHKNTTLCARQKKPLSITTSLFNSSKFNIPYLPPITPLPPPPFNLGDPTTTTWPPHIPSFSHPPPAFNLGDPTTWIPHISPSPPNIPPYQNP